MALVSAIVNHSYLQHIYLKSVVDQPHVQLFAFASFDCAFSGSLRILLDFHNT